MCIWSVCEVKNIFSAGDFLKQAEDWTSQQGTQAPVERVVEFNSIYELDCWSGRIVNLDMEWFTEYYFHCVWLVLWWRRAWFNDQQFHYQSTCWHCWNVRLLCCSLGNDWPIVSTKKMGENVSACSPGRNASSIQFFPASAMWSEETHPRISIAGRKLWFAGGPARNASPVEKKMRAATWDARVIWHAIMSIILQCCSVDR